MKEPLTYNKISDEGRFKEDDGGGSTKRNWMTENRRPKRGRDGQIDQTWHEEDAELCRMSGTVGDALAF